MVYNRSTKIKVATLKTVFDCCVAIQQLFSVQIIIFISLSLELTHQIRRSRSRC